MASERQQHRAEWSTAGWSWSPISNPARTFYVGRRPFETAELYVVTPGGVDRMCSRQRFRSTRLDWTTSDRAALELGFAMLAHVGRAAPDEVLVTRFVADVLSRMPVAGFVLAATDILLWVKWASTAADWSPLKRRGSHAPAFWLRRLRGRRPADRSNH